MRNITIVAALLVTCAIAQAGITSLICTFPDDPAGENHEWSFTPDETGGGLVELTETYVAAFPGTDSVNVSGYADVDPVVRFTKYVTNGNGHDWTAYTITINPLAGVFFTGTPSSDLFDSAVISNGGLLLTYSDGVVNPGQEVALNFSILVPNAGDFGWCLTQQAIPEPATMLLLGLGGLLLRRK